MTAQRRNREGDPVNRPAPPSRDLTRREHDQVIAELTRSYELKMLKIQNELGVSHADLQKILSGDSTEERKPADKQPADKPKADDGERKFDEQKPKKRGK